MTGFIWMLVVGVAADQVATGLVRVIHVPEIRPLVREALFLAALMIGFAALSWIATRRGRFNQVNALPKRASAGEEWQRGAAIGWGALLLTLLPMMLAGDLHPQFWWAPRAWALMLEGILALLLGSLASEVAFRGFIFRSLMDAWGPTAATLVTSLAYAGLSGLQPNASVRSFFVTFSAAVLFSVTYLRTRALWLGWGLHFGWLVSMGAWFGLPVDGSLANASVVATDVSGTPWLTGGAFGPEGALPSLLALTLALWMVVVVTRDWAWEYAAPAIVPGGYPMEVAAPAAHQAMEAAAAARPAPLVQILPSTPKGASSTEAVTDHLAGRGSQSGTERGEPDPGIAVDPEI